MNNHSICQNKWKLFSINTEIFRNHEFALDHCNIIIVSLTVKLYCHNMFDGFFSPLACTLLSGLVHTRPCTLDDMQTCQDFINLHRLSLLERGKQVAAQTSVIQ